MNRRAILIIPYWLFSIISQSHNYVWCQAPTYEAPTDSDFSNSPEGRKSVPPHRGVARRNPIGGRAMFLPATSPRDGESNVAGYAQRWHPRPGGLRLCPKDAERNLFQPQRRVGPCRRGRVLGWCHRMTVGNRCFRGAGHHPGSENNSYGCQAMLSFRHGTHYCSLSLSGDRHHPTMLYLRHENSQRLLQACALGGGLCRRSACGCCRVCRPWHD